MGIGVPLSCEDALAHYSRVAKKGQLLWAIVLLLWAIVLLLWAIVLLLWAIVLLLWTSNTTHSNKYEL